jgi:GTP-binding protein
MLCDRNKLAKTSGRPGKTQLINHFDIDEKWYLVDLPGYGFAKVPKTERAKWKKFTWDYLENRANLMCVFVLVDGRIDPQSVDIGFMNELGDKGIPFQIVFTKMEKVKTKEKSEHFKAFSNALLKTWETLPTYFHSSAVSKEGQAEILQFIKKTNPLYDPNGQL